MNALACYGGFTVATVALALFFGLPALLVFIAVLMMVLGFIGAVEAVKP